MNPRHKEAAWKLSRVLRAIVHEDLEAQRGQHEARIKELESAVLLSDGSIHGLHVESEATAAELAPAPTPPRSEPSESSAKAAGGAKRSKQPGLGMGCCAAPAPRARRKPAGGKAGQAKPELKDQAVH